MDPLKKYCSNHTIIRTNFNLFISLVLVFLTRMGFAVSCRVHHFVAERSDMH